MKSNEASKAIYSMNARIFAALHVKLDFDMEQEITVKRLPAPFTIRAAWKAIEGDALTPYNARAAIIMRDSRPTHYYNTPRLVPLTADNISDDYDKMSYHEYDRANHYMLIIDDFIRKGDFNDLRKAKTCEAFIIAQRKDLLKPWTKPARDWTERQRDMKPGEHEQRTTHNYWNRTLPPIIIDKSNYRVDMIRADRAQRAKKLRAERAKAAADAATQATAADRYNDLTQALQAARQRVINALTALDFNNVTGATVESLRAIAKAIGEYSYNKGLSAAADRMNDFKRNTQEQRYSSPDRYNEAYNSIINNLAAILPEEV